MKKISKYLLHWIEPAVIKAPIGMVHYCTESYAKSFHWGGDHTKGRLRPAKFPKQTSLIIKLFLSKASIDQPAQFNSEGGANAHGNPHFPQRLMLCCTLGQRSQVTGSWTEAVPPQRGAAEGQWWKQCFCSGILMVAILQASRGKTWHSPVQAVSPTKEPLT